MSEKVEWFDKLGGLAFECTMCGNCCSGPSGYVLVSEEEVEVLAERFGLTTGAFKRRYTTVLPEGRSLKEVKSEAGLDCVFLDRETIPGKAICGVYEDRPAQCRTWPFWKSNLKSKRAWERAKKICPGMDRGKLVKPIDIRVEREKIDI